MSAVVRHALYFVPADETQLASFGQAILRRDAMARPVAALSGLPRVPDAWLVSPARYGFHATLKAPFRLAGDTTEQTLVDACDQLAAANAPCLLTGLSVQHLRTFVALMQPTPDAAVDALAADCVVALEPFRAPMNEAERARRRPDRLDPAALARLEQWGYPHVFEGFRFHMTLSSSLEDSAERDAWVAALSDAFHRLVPDTPVLDRLALCRQESAQVPFVRIAEFPLRTQAAESGA